MNLFGHIVAEADVPFFLLLHFIISIVLMFLASWYVSKRYVSDSEEVNLIDQKRLQAIEGRTWLFRFLFKISLHKNNPISSKLFFFLFNISIPIIGYIETIWIAYLLRHTTYEVETIDTNILDLEEFGTSFLEVERVFGEGSMISVLLNPFVPLTKKIRALSALAADKSPATLQIIKKALSSKDDEVRLFAYATINNLEKKLSTDISMALQKYKPLKEKEEELSREEKEQLYSAAKELSFLYWEMVYTEISHDALKKNFLNEVKKYSSEAIDFYQEYVEELEDQTIDLEEKILQLKKEEEKEEEIKILKKEIEKNNSNLKNHYNSLARLYVLKGRVYMTEKNYSLAETFFNLAQEIKESDSDFVIPYLAEIYFIQKNFKIVRNIIKEKAESLSLNPRLYPIIQQWSTQHAN